MCILNLPAPLLVIFFIVFFYTVPGYIVSFVTRKPPLWWIRSQREEILEIYKRALGFLPGTEIFKATFAIRDGRLSFRTNRNEIVIPLDEVRWVRRSGDLVVVGCFNGWSSVHSPVLSLQSGPHYKPCLAAVFMASKVEGMDSNELMTFLSRCVKKRKRFKHDGYIKTLPDGESCCSEEMPQW